MRKKCISLLFIMFSLYCPSLIHGMGIQSDEQKRESGWERELDLLARLMKSNKQFKISPNKLF